jgi:hypothetical protein
MSVTNSILDQAITQIIRINSKLKPCKKIMVNSLKVKEELYKDWSKKCMHEVREGDIMGCSVEVNEYQVEQVVVLE